MVLCLASRPRQQGCQGLPGSSVSHWIPPGPTGSHRLPAGATGSHLVPPASSARTAAFPRPPWGAQPGGLVDVTVPRAGRESPHPRVGWLRHPLLPTEPHSSEAGQGPAHVLGTPISGLTWGQAPTGSCARPRALSSPPRQPCRVPTVPFSSAVAIPVPRAGRGSAAPL